MKPVKLTAALIESFAGIYLSPRYDEPQPTPPFHRECWALYASSCPQCLVVAPRDHAKSTALTFDYILAEVCFRVSDYVILIGSTEEKAAEQLSNILEELRENDDLRRDFGIKEFERDSKTDVIVRCTDGHRFRVLARGAEQKIRGAMWKGKRPNLIVADDMEDDEQVENADRRVKFRKWFFRAAKQALSQSGKIRVHGTILHDDSLLSRLLKNKVWHHLFFKAHRNYDEFLDLLWPERWTEAKLRARQQEFIGDLDPGGYSQEFLNDPMDSAEAYLKKDDFIELSKEEYERGFDQGNEQIVCAAADFAVSKADLANRTSFTIGGRGLTNRINFIDQRTGRWDTLEWIDQMFLIQRRWHPDVFWVEDGVIWKSVRPMLLAEMEARQVFINFEAVPSVTDKASRGRPLQKHMRAGQCRFNKRAEWYSGFEHELLRFTGSAQATLDDQFDSAGLLVRGFEKMSFISEEDFLTEEGEAFERERPRVSGGQSEVTGY